MSDLALDLAASSSAVSSGQAIDYTITVSNHGPSQNTGVVLTGTLALGTILNVSDPDCAVTGRDITCVFGTMEVGDLRVVTINGFVSSTRDTPLLVSAAVSGENPEPIGDLLNSGAVTTAVNAYHVYLPGMLVFSSDPIDVTTAP